MIESDKVTFRIMDIYRSMPKEVKFRDIFITLLLLKRLSDVSEEKERINSETNNANKELNQSVSQGIIVPESVRWPKLLKIKGDLGQNLMKAFDTIEQNNDCLKGVLTSLTAQVYDIGGDDKIKNSIFRIIQDLSLIPMGNHNYKSEKQFPEIFDFVILKIMRSSYHGEFSTDVNIAKLLASILDPEDNMTVHDPFCGIGKVLVECAKYAEEKDGQVSLYGQEITETAWRYCIYSLIVNNYTTSVVKMGDTIRDPAFIGNEELLQFDRVVSVPPFGKQKWGHEIANMDKYNRFRYGIPPKSTGDMAYLQHTIACLKDDGKAVTVSPQGILFRGGPEGEIRKHLILNDFIEAVILLPSNFFAHTAIQTIIVVINMNKPVERHDSILFISAQNLGEEIKRKVVLDDADIAKIVGAYRDYKGIDKFCRIVDLEEIKNNDYSLNFSLYIDIFPEIEIVDVKKTLNQIQELHVKKEQLMNKILDIMDTSD